MAVKKEKQPGVGTREPINKQPGVGTQEPSVTAVTKQREEWVQMFQKLFHRVRMWMRPEGPEKTSTQRRKVQNTMVRISSR